MLERGLCLLVLLAQDLLANSNYVYFFQSLPSLRADRRVGDLLEAELRALEWKLVPFTAIMISYPVLVKILVFGKCGRARSLDLNRAPSTA